MHDGCKYHSRSKRAVSRLLAPVFVFVMSGCALAQDSESTDAAAEFLQPRYEDFGEAHFIPRAVVLRLPNGNSVHFAATYDERGEITGHSVTEFGRAQNLGIASIPELTNANAAAVFYALSAAGTELPDFLKIIRSETASTRHQGWARDRILSGGPPAGGGQSLICPETSWTWDSFVAAITGWNFTFVFLSEGDGPSTEANHWSPMGGFFAASGLMELNGGVDDVTAYYTQVLYCEEDSEETVHFPRVSIRSGLSILMGHVYQQLFNPGDSVSHHWLAYEELLSEGGTRDYAHDFRLRISEVADTDKFYIGATWSKPFGTLGTLGNP